MTDAVKFLDDPLRIFQSAADIPPGSAVFFGCSFTRGLGVDPSQRYSALMSTELGYKEYNLADQILNNYKSFDVFSQLNFSSNKHIIVLQLTELSRIQTFQYGTPNIRQLSNQPSRCYLEIYHDRFLIFELIKNLRYLVSVCRLKSLPLIIWSIARLAPNLQAVLERYLQQFPEYVYLSSDLDDPDSYRVDNGSDGGAEIGSGHPGPVSHRRIADRLIKHYQELYHDIQSHQTS